MLTKRSISVPFIATLIAFSSTTAMAAENADTSLLPPIWPLLLLVFLVIVFRKKLSCAPPTDIEESDNTVVKEQAPAEQKEPALETKNTNTKTKSESVDIKAKAKAKNEIIDLKGNSSQCQASTAKGTRCKRKTMLEDAVISIDNKRYSLTVCKQHNTDSLKPFPELI